MNMFRTSVIKGAILLGVAFTVPGIAAASGGNAPLSITVAYTDLNPANAKDATELYKRLQSATQQVCAPYALTQANQYQARKSCYRQVLAHAVQQVNSHEVTTLHANAAQSDQSTQLVAAESSKMGSSKNAKLSK